ncbi:hypothetical protein [Krasilnikovia sp. MM14-A1259]|uniref:hypothetical protein n=1 Tax=Krasilnikovia sp. MM14-A1259 TaxID=3373539 RepID=UPI00399CDD2E
MTVRAAHRIAVPFVLMAFGLRLLADFWAFPLALRLDPASLSLGALMGAQVVAVVIPLGGYWWCTRRVWRRPPTWRVDADRRHFVADLSPRLGGPQAVVIGWASAALVPRERVPDTDRMRIADLGAVTDVGIALAVVALAAGIAMALANRPRLMLDPRGVVLQGLVRSRGFRWDELVPGGPALPATPNPREITLYRQPPADAPLWFLPWRLPAYPLHVDPAFLAHTLRRYLDHPECRDRVGTAEELAALHEGSASPMPTG